MSDRVKQAKAVEKLYGKKTDSKTPKQKQTKIKVSPYKVSKNSVGIKVKWTF